MVTSETAPETWLISRLEAALADSSEHGEHIDLPKFQRSVVWSEKKQKDLIDSLLEGFPVGSLLFYERPGASPRKTYLLVDGLQRTTAIQNYLKEPLAYMSASALDSDLLENVQGEVRALAGGMTITDDHINAFVESWMRSTRTLEQVKGFSGYRLAKVLVEEFAPDSGEGEREHLLSACDALVDDMRERCDIRSIALPAIVYRGREEALPDIFERINALGTTLSKYEIFAAAWVDQETDIHHEQIRDAIARRYQDYLDRGFRVHGIREDGSIEDYSLFDYLFGLGKLLSQRYPLLFGEDSDATATQSVAFTLAAVSHGLRLSEMKTLPQSMYRASGGRIDPSVFEDALLDACDFVHTTLRPYIGIRLNSASGGLTVSHTEYQIASMICRVLAGRFVPAAWEEREDWEADRVKLRTHLPQYYLHDLLVGGWRGAGDTKLFYRTWRIPDGASEPVPSSVYLEPIPSADWEATLRSYFEEQVVRVQRMRSHIRAIDKLFLRFVYSGIVSYMEEMQKSFEIDHLLPVSRLIDLIGEDGEGWPISHVANLALFETALNREKTKYTIPEYLERSATASAAGESRSRAIDRYLLCEAGECGIPRDRSGRDRMTRDDYVEFLRKRFVNMGRQVADSLGLHGVDVGAALRD